MENNIQSGVNIETYDWADRVWSASLVLEAKEIMGDVMLVICPPSLFNRLMIQGFNVRTYQVQLDAQQYACQYINGDIVWQIARGMPDDALIMSNLDKICIFHGFGYITHPQMPEYKRQEGNLANPLVNEQRERDAINKLNLG